MSGGVLMQVYRFEFYTPRTETWPVVRTYPRLPLHWETFRLFWR